MYNPEEAFFRKHVPEEEELCPGEERVYQKYISEHKKQEPKMDDFSDVYSEIEIKKDKKYLASIKEGFQFYKTERSEILEIVLARQIDQTEWFGENCFVVQSSEYDDVINHTDLVAEFREKDEIIRLAIDVTTSEDKAVLDKKIGYIEKDIDNNKLTTLKYYLFEETEPYTKGKAEMIPRVIIGTNKEGVKELSGLVEKTIKKEEGSNKELADFYAQIEFLEEIKEQLEYFIDYAKAKKECAPEHPLINQQEKVLNIINRILENKKRSTSLPSRARTNGIYRFLTNLSL